MRKDLATYGTMAQSGNVSEWTESAVDGINDDIGESRVVRGGSWQTGIESLLGPEGAGANWPSFQNGILGFRVASVIPEPTTFTLLSLGTLALVVGRRR